MAYMPELHYCCDCGEYLGPDNGDGICMDCEMKCDCGRPLPDNSNWDEAICPACLKKEQKRSRRRNANPDPDW